MIYVKRSVRKYFQCKFFRKKYDDNTEEYMKISRLLASKEIKDPDLQLKITAFMSGDIVVCFILSDRYISSFYAY